MVNNETQVIDEIVDALPIIDSRAGLYGLAMVIGGIIIFDVCAPETISNAIDRFHEAHPVAGRVATASVLGGLAIHLLTPKDKDPFRRIIKSGERRYYGTTK